MKAMLRQWWTARPLRLLAPVLAVLLVAACNPLEPRMGIQGQLTDPQGRPVADGTYDARFRLFRTSSSSTAVYTETKTITVQNGVFDAAIGVSPAITPSLLSEATWLEVTINGETLSPRQRLLGAPYALSLVAGAVAQGAVDREAFLTPGGVQIGSAFVGLNTSAASTGGSGLAGVTNSGWGGAAGVYGTAVGSSGYGGWFTSVNWRGIYARGKSGEYAAWFGGDINVTGNCNGCNLTFVAQNAGDETLAAGDIVTVVGVEMDTQNGVPVMLVRKAQAGDPLIGVVAHAARRTPLVREMVYGPDSGGYDPAEGPVASAGYLMVLTQGLAQVQVGTSAVPVGAWLTMGEGGNALAAASPDANVLGRVLSPADNAGLAWVMVAPR